MIMAIKKKRGRCNERGGRGGVIGESCMAGREGEGRRLRLTPFDSSLFSTAGQHTWEARCSLKGWSGAICRLNTRLGMRRNGSSL